MQVVSTRHRAFLFCSAVFCLILTQGCAITNTATFGDVSIDSPVSKILVDIQGGSFSIANLGHNSPPARAICEAEDWTPMPKTPYVLVDVKPRTNIGFRLHWVQNVGYGNLTCRGLSSFVAGQDKDYLLVAHIKAGNTCELLLSEVKITRDPEVLTSPTATETNLIVDNITEARSLRFHSCKS